MAKVYNTKMAIVIFLYSVIPNCVCYDPTYAYEMAVIVQDGLKRMYQEKRKVFYYITSLNENYPHPPCPKVWKRVFAKACIY